MGSHSFIIFQISISIYIKKVNAAFEQKPTAKAAVSKGKRRLLAVLFHGAEV